MPAQISGRCILPKSRFTFIKNVNFHNSLLWCPCIENGDNVRLFKKRFRSNSLTSAKPKMSKMRGGGPLATGDGPAPRVVACLELNSIESLPVQLNAMSIRVQKSIYPKAPKKKQSNGDTKSTNSAKKSQNLGVAEKNSSTANGKPKNQKQYPATVSVFGGKIPQGTNVEELKEVIIAKGVKPINT